MYVWGLYLIDIIAYSRVDGLTGLDPDTTPGRLQARTEPDGRREHCQRDPHAIQTGRGQR